MIHPTAIVSPEARLGADVTIGPYAIVEGGVMLGDRCVLHASCKLCRGTELGAGVIVHSFAVIGGDPQMLRFDPATASSVRVGAGTVLRESVTINRSTKAGGCTTVGASGFLMACAHVAHDCELGDRVVMANASMLAGHCVIGSDVFFGGGCTVHQFTRIGEGVMMGGMAGVSLDVPPFVMLAERNRVVGLNLIGLRRRNVPRAAIVELKSLYARVYGAGNPKQAAAEALAGGAAESAEGRRFLEFFNATKRGVIRPRRGGAGDEADDAGGAGGEG